LVYFVFIIENARSKKTKPVQHVTVLNTVGNCNTMVL